MAQSASIELVGARELDVILSGLDAKVSRKLAGKALRAGAKIIQQEAKALAPVLKEPRADRVAGAMRAAIKVRAGKSRKGFRSVIVAVGTKWFAGDEFYAGFQEFGWKTGKRGRAAAAKRQAARRQIEGKHFMQRAAEAKKDAAISAITDTLRDLATEAINK